MKEIPTEEFINITSYIFQHPQPLITLPGIYESFAFNNLSNFKMKIDGIFFQHISCWIYEKYYKVENVVIFFNTWNKRFWLFWKLALTKVISQLRLNVFSVVGPFSLPSTNHKPSARNKPSKSYIRKSFHQWFSVLK